MKISAAILVTSHKHGTDYGLYRNEAIAYEVLYDYVCEFWGDNIESEMPEGKQEAIDKYYEHNVYNEWWEICTRTLDLGGSDLNSLRVNETGYPVSEIVRASDEEEIR